MPSRLTRPAGSCWMPKRLYRLRLQQEHERQRREADRHRGTLPGQPVHHRRHSSHHHQVQRQPEATTIVVASDQLRARLHPRRQSATTATTSSVPVEVPPTVPAATHGAGAGHHADSMLTPLVLSLTGSGSTTLVAPGVAGMGADDTTAVTSSSTGGNRSSSRGSQQRQRELMRELGRLRALKEEMERQVKESQRELERVSRFALRLEQTRVRAIEITRGVTARQQDEDQAGPAFPMTSTATSTPAPLASSDVILSTQETVSEQ